MIIDDELCCVELFYEAVIRQAEEALYRSKQRVKTNTAIMSQKQSNR